MAIRRPLSGMNRPMWRFYDIIDNPEYQFGENLVTEYTDITGIECYYLISDQSVLSDPLYGEKQDVEYKEARKTKIIYEIGEIPTVYSMFGVMSQDTIIAYIPRSVYKRDVSQTEVPKVGDVVRIPMYPWDFTDDPIDAGRAFEIIHVAQDTSIFQYRSLVYVFNMIPYRFSEESDSARLASYDIDDTQPWDTTTPSITGYGDNTWIDENKEIDNSVDSSIYGYSIAFMMLFGDMMFKILNMGNI